ncbi:amidase domain-containing protein [Paenibacillus soyae]|uniref:Amidase domain-containing protein n=1 Tax=Paenibacillus soyae TaxID=2969249 RepID=A0A9X2MQS5_9BACL|nr:amidase domain-containing protein [Paenibacillus soyae]MCR2804464.1 amidase domain-containing protein [Paenibacillus soyae]
MSKAGNRSPASGREKRGDKKAKKSHSALSSSSGRLKKTSSPADVRIDHNQADNVKQPRLSSLIQSSEPSGPRAAGQSGNWKGSVQEYVKLYNQAETDQHSRVLTDFLADPVHGDRLRQRLERLRDRDLYRGAIPAGSETKAELVRVNESASEVSVLIKLHIKRRMEQGGRFYIEERYEYERLWLAVSGQRWDVLQVEPVIAERRPRYGVSVHQLASEPDRSPQEEVYVMPSLPYLNYDLMPPLQNRVKGIRYRRDLAAAYADRWWNEGNPAYELFEVNCTNYVSQCIFAGNAPMNYTGKRGSGWWYKGRSGGQEWWSYSWAVSHALTQYLAAARKSGLHAVETQTADELQLGDVITYDWNGDGRFQHSTIVTAFDSAGQPLVNANTVPSRHRYWDYRDSYAWSKGTRYRFFHIPDTL